MSGDKLGDGRLDEVIATFEQAGQFRLDTAKGIPDLDVSKLKKGIQGKALAIAGDADGAGASEVVESVNLSEALTIQLKIEQQHAMIAEMRSNAKKAANSLAAWLKDGSVELSHVAAVASVLDDLLNLVLAKNDRAAELSVPENFDFEALSLGGEKVDAKLSAAALIKAEQAASFIFGSVSQARSIIEGVYRREGVIKKATNWPMKLDDEQKELFQKAKLVLMQAAYFVN